MQKKTKNNCKILCAIVFLFLDVLLKIKGCKLGFD